MARPLRCFEEGRHYEVADRTLGEVFRLLPSATVNAILLAAMVVAMAAVPEVRPIGFTVMSNHWHLLLRAGPDSTAVSRFMQVLKSQVAIAVIDHDGIRGRFWARRFSSIAVLDEASVLVRLVYFLLNPVKAGLCARFEEWTGISTTKHLVGVRSACGDVELRLGLPPSWEGLDEAQLAAQRAQLLAEVRAQEAAIAEDRRKRGLPRARLEQALRRVSHDSASISPKRGRKPLCFASSQRASDAHRRRWREWVETYRAASEAFRAGVLDVEFPARALPPRLARPPSEAAA